MWRVEGFVGFEGFEGAEVVEGPGHARVTFGPVRFSAILVLVPSFPPAHGSILYRPTVANFKIYHRYTSNGST